MLKIIIQFLPFIRIETTESMQKLYHNDRSFTNNMRIYYFRLTFVAIGVTNQKEDNSVSSISGVGCVIDNCLQKLDFRKKFLPHFLTLSNRLNRLLLQ